MDVDFEDTLETRPWIASDEAKTRQYVRPGTAKLVWGVVPPGMEPVKPRRRQKSHHTITKTRPALRYMVGMPVVRPAPPPPATPPVAAPPIAAPPERRGALGLAVLAAISVAVALVLALFVLLQPSPRGDVVVSAYGVSGLSTVAVIANGETECTDVPCRIELPPGEHYVAVVAPGYERPQSRRVALARGEEANVHFELVPRVP